MKITDVRVYPVNVKSVIANASITIDDEVVIYVKVIEGKNGAFLSLPNHSYKDDNGDVIYKDDVYFLHRETMREVVDQIMEKLADTEKKKSGYKRKR